MTYISYRILNKLSPSDMPPRTLELKVGAPIILLRNLNLEKGLVNGTRLKLANIHRYLLTATFIMEYLELP